MRRSPFQTASARDFAIPANAAAKLPKSSSETTRPSARIGSGALRRACAIVSGSAPPVAATGFVSPRRPSGRLSGIVIASAATLPAAPTPTR